MEYAAITPKKRDGRVIPFNGDRITRAIFLAATNVAEKEGVKPDYKVSENLTQEVIRVLNSKYINSIPSVEDIQDVVVKGCSVLILRNVK